MKIYFSTDLKFMLWILHLILFLSLKSCSLTCLQNTCFKLKQYLHKERNSFNGLRRKMWTLTLGNRVGVNVKEILYFSTSYNAFVAFMKTNKNMKVLIDRVL